MEKMSLVEMMGASMNSLANIMGGDLKAHRLKGDIKTYENLLEKWPNMPSNDGFTEIQYFNKKGLNVKTEYFQNGICETCSVYYYDKDLIISEKTTTGDQKLISSSEFIYYKDKKIKYTKETRLDEDSKTDVYEVSEVFYYYNLLNNIEKIEDIDYLINEAGAIISAKEKSHTLFEYDYKKRITKEYNYNNLGGLYALNESYYNELGAVIRDKQTYVDTYYSTNYNYDKDGSLFSFERFADGTKVNVSTKKITEKKDKKLLSKLGSEFEAISDNVEGRTVWSNKIEYDEIGNVIKKTTYADSEITCIQEYQITYY